MKLRYDGYGFQASTYISWEMTEVRFLADMAFGSCFRWGVVVTEGEQERGNEKVSRGFREGQQVVFLEINSH